MAMSESLAIRCSWREFCSPRLSEDTFPMGYILKGIKVTESQISDVILLCLQSDDSINVAMVSIHGITSTHES